MKTNIFRIFFLFFLVQAVGLGKTAFAAELKQGRYIGWVYLNEAKERVAVVTEFLLESPEDLTQFPRLKAIFKLSLGGYNTHEYFTETFEDIQYDFDNGVLTLDAPNNDLMMTAQVSKEGSDTIIKGQVFVRSSALFGSLYLKQESDEPGDDEESIPEPPEGIDRPFVPLLEGQYEGACDGKSAMFQFQTVRGLKTIWQQETETSSIGRYYGIVGRLGFKNSEMCGRLGPKQWCTLFNYGGASYNFYLGGLNLYSDTSAEECTLKQGNLKCRIRRSTTTLTCEMKKKNSVIKPATFFLRKFQLRPTLEQKAELPPPEPPKNLALSTALRGTFAGYLHNETNDTYEVVRLNVLPFSSTENPHNPNEMMVTSSASIYLDHTQTKNFITQRYGPRSFYLRPGFILDGPKTDSYINILEWKQGYIRGEWYSHAFGKVGTVQLVKGELPPLPSGAKLVSSFVGEFKGPENASDLWFRLLFPTQPSDLIDHLIRFTGSYQLINISAIHNIERGTFDPYTGVFGWINSRDDASTFVSGIVNDQSLKLFWPPAPHLFGATTNDYDYVTYKRQAQ